MTIFNTLSKTGPLAEDDWEGGDPNKPGGDAAKKVHDLDRLTDPASQALQSGAKNS